MEVYLVSQDFTKAIKFSDRLYVGQCYKEGKKDNLTYGIFEDNSLHEPADAIAQYSTKAKAADALKVLMDFVCQSSVICEARTLPNGLPDHSNLKPFSNPSILYYQFPKEQ